jgi:hypothetical protein
MKKTKDPKGETEVIAERMVNSLTSTCRGLEMFSDSLQKSGFVSSLPAYKQMMSVLVQQKRWSDSHSREEMQQIWDDIAKHADILYNILKSYSDVMDVLRAINKHTQKPAQNENKTLQYLKRYSLIPVSELSENLKMKKKDINAELEPFVKSGKIEKKGRGRNLCYRLLK